MEHDVQIDLKNSSIDSVLATLRTQGITSLEDLVERTVGSVDDVLSSRADEAEAFGCCFICSPTGHGYVYVVVTSDAAPPA